MTLTLAILTVACVSWIITREQIFARLQKWARPRKYATPLVCMYCLAPWLTALVFVVNGLPLVWFFPCVWLSYWNLALFAKVRG